MEGRGERRARVLGPRGARTEHVSLAEEADVRVVLRGRTVARLVASPVALEELALGHLVLRGKLRTRADVRDVQVRLARDGWRVDVDARVATRAMPRPPPARVTRTDLLARMHDLHGSAASYRAGGGVHTSALASPTGLVHVAADVGKVNTLDRLAGQALLAGTRPRDAPLLLTTGRFTAAMVERAAALGCAILVSHSGPTVRAVDLAELRGATLVGYARGGRCTVYAQGRRIRG